MTSVLPTDRAQRAFAGATLVNMTGSGLWVASSALYATRVLGLSVTGAGVALTVAALVGQLAGIPVGQLADRRDPRTVYVATKVASAVPMAALVLVHGLAAFTALCAAVALLSSGSGAARGPIVRGLGGADPVRFRAFLQSVGNLGIALGGAAAGIAIQFDHPGAYQALILGNAASSLLCAGLVRLFVGPVPRPAPTTATSAAPQAVRDRRFVLLTVGNGLMTLHAGLMSFALPLWIVTHTSAPRGVVGLIVVLNTVIVVACQVRVAAGISSSRGALSMLSRAGLAFLAMAVAVAASATMSGWAAAVTIVGAVVIYTLGELWHSAASFELMFRLAPAHAQGQYAGLFNLGQGLAGAAAPLLLGVVCLDWGAPGWLLAGTVLAAVGLTTTLLLAEPGRHRLRLTLEPA